MKWIIPLLLLAACQRVEVNKQKVNGIELAYYTRGQGEPLLLIMGYHGTMSIWDPAFLNELAKHYKVIVFDNRGVGLSTDTKENHTTIEQMANDTVQLIKSLGFKKVNLLGWSMGSMIAMQIAFDYPEVLNTLILCSPNPGGSHSVKRTTDAYAKLTSTDLSAQEGLSLIYPNRASAEEFVSRLTHAIKHGHVPDDLNISKQTIERQKEAVSTRDKDNTIYEKLSKIKVPTLVAGGLEDEIDAPENVQRVAHQIPYAWSAYFPCAGHAFASQDHLQFGRLVRIFIESQK